MSRYVYATDGIVHSLYAGPLNGNQRSLCRGKLINEQADEENSGHVVFDCTTGAHKIRTSELTAEPAVRLGMMVEVAELRDGIVADERMRVFFTDTAIQMLFGMSFEDITQLTGQQQVDKAAPWMGSVMKITASWTAPTDGPNRPVHGRIPFVQEAELLEPGHIEEDLQTQI
jgi:hypothetical protein